MQCQAFHSSIDQPQRTSLQLAHTAAKPTRAQAEEFPLVASSTSGDEQDCWIVTSPLTFENIGFTKGVVSNEKEKAQQLALASLPEGASVRYLACADCDCGPLGWHVESKGSDLGRDVDMEIGSNGAPAAAAVTNPTGPLREFLLAVERCRYKVQV